MLKTISSKITFFSSIVIIVTMVLITYLIYNVSASMMHKNAEEGFASRAKLIANEVENGVVKIRNEIVFLSKTPPIQGIVRSVQKGGEDKLTQSNIDLWTERLEDIFISMLEVNPNFTQIRYIGKKNNGKEIVRVDRQGSSLHRIHKSALQEKGKSKYFLRGSQLTGGSVYFSLIDYNKEKGKVQYPLVPTLRIITPVYTEGQDVFGMLVINTNIARYLRDIFIRNNHKGKIVFYNNHNNFLIYDGVEQKVEYYSGLENKNISFLGSKYQEADFIKKIRGSQNNNYVIDLPIYSNNYHDFSPFGLIIAEPRSALDKKNYTNIDKIILWMLVISTIASVLIYWFSRSVTSQLTRMANYLRLSTHKYQHSLELPTHLEDEVGMLARAFEEKTNQLSKLANFDSLTGLPNRESAMQFLEEGILKAKQNGSLLIIGFVDLNGFKEINDTYGHLYGDELLVQFSNTLKSIKRDDSDFVARIAGDEFIIIIGNVDAKKDIINIFSRYADKLNQTYLIKGVTINLQTSVGVAVYPNHGSNSKDLLSAADQAMYDSKAEKKGRVFICGSTN